MERIPEEIKEKIRELEKIMEIKEKIKELETQIEYEEKRLKLTKERLKNINNKKQRD